MICFFFLYRRHSDHDTAISFLSSLGFKDPTRAYSLDWADGEHPISHLWQPQLDASSPSTYHWMTNQVWSTVLLRLRIWQTILFGMFFCDDGITKKYLNVFLSFLFWGNVKRGNTPGRRVQTRLVVDDIFNLSNRRMCITTGICTFVQVKCTVLIV